jgi:hypothetical protein
MSAEVIGRPRAGTQSPFTIARLVLLAQGTILRRVLLKWFAGGGRRSQEGGLVEAAQLARMQPLERHVPERFQRPDPDQEML